MLVTIYTHHFTVSGHDRAGFDFLVQFGLKYLAEPDFRAIKQNKWLRKMNRELLPTVARVYAARTKNGREFRFHINCLEMFKRALEEDRFYNPTVEYKVMDVYEPNKIDIKVLDKYKPFDEQIPLIEYLSSLQYSKVLSLRTGGGKMQGENEPVLTPVGWKPIKDIEVGEQVLSPDGQPIEVDGKYIYNDIDLYRFKLADGRSTLCGLEHLWLAWINNVRQVVTTETIMKALKNKDTVSIPNIGSYDGFSDLDYKRPIDPYLLGLLLASGKLRDGQMVLSTDTTGASRAKSIIEQMGLVLKSTKLPHLRVIEQGEDEEVYKAFMQQMKDYGLFSLDARVARIPPAYKDAPDDVRYTLYKGMKAGFLVNSREERYNKTSTGIKLMNDFTYLCRSLGFSVVSKFIKGIRRHKRSVSVVELIDQRTNVSSVKLEETGKRAICIRVKSKDSLYVTRDFIVTHNTYCSLQSAANRGGKVLITIETKFFKLWEEALLPKINGKPNPKQILDLKKEEVVFIQGGRDLKKVLEMALNDELKEVKAFVMASRTFTLYLECYEKYPKDFGLYYPVYPVNFYEVLDIGTRIKDELHLGLASNFTEELYLHCGNSISLSATLENGTFKDTILGWMFPMNTRAPDSELKKYIDCTALMYGVSSIDKVRYTVRGSDDYNHNEFEKWILKDKKRTEAYMGMIDKWVQVRYLNVREEGQGHKGAIFASFVDMATAITAHLRKKFPHLKIGRYAASTGDSYDKASKSDLLVTTIKSFGTGFDLHGLICSLMTVAIDSPDANIQTLGRLRELKQWPHITPTFDYFVCESIGKHMNYHENKKRLFRDRVKSHKQQWTGTILN